MSENLGPRLARTAMHMFWLLDVSGSMTVDGKIEALNRAMSEAAESVRSAADENPGVQVLIRVITFADDATWHVGEPVDIEQFQWSNVQAVDRGTTELGRAISLATEAIREVSQMRKGLPPALVLVSDGKPTDLRQPTHGAALRELAAEPWGAKASRMAIGIGKDADIDALRHFIGHDEIEPLLASNAEELSHYLKWASTVVVDQGNRPTPRRVAAPPEPAVPPPAPPASVLSDDDVQQPSLVKPAAAAPAVRQSLPPAPPPPPDDAGPVW